jgi:hypothetical protein
VVEQPTGSRDDQVDTLLEPVGLGLAVGATHDDAKRLRVMRHELLDDAKDLERQLARRGDDDDTGTCASNE